MSNSYNIINVIFATFFTIFAIGSIVHARMETLTLFEGMLINTISWIGFVYCFNNIVTKKEN